MKKEKDIKVKRKAALIVLAVLIVVSAAAELIINAGKEDVANVHIQIRCDKVAEAPETLVDPALEEYIPEDGIAMARLKYIAKEEGLVETIGYLKNGDCGENSRWEYTVNGELRKEKPDDCKVTDGDEIVWAFTLDGGMDIENV